DAEEAAYILHHRILSGSRFHSEDPAEDDLNPYRYARNNPVNESDPSGLQGTPSRAVLITRQTESGDSDSDLVQEARQAIQDGLRRFDPSNIAPATVEGLLSKGLAKRVGDAVLIPVGDR